MDTRTHRNSHTDTHVPSHLRDGKALGERETVRLQGPLGSVAPPPGLEGPSSSGSAVCPESGTLGWQERLNPQGTPPKVPACPAGTRWGLSIPGDVASPQSSELGGGGGHRRAKNEGVGSPQTWGV